MILRLFAVIFVAASLSGCAVFQEDLPVGDEVDFSRHIKPILERNCLQCHNRQSMPERTSFETRELALKQGKHGYAIIPGDPDNSRIVNFINAPRDTLEAMPRTRHVVSVEDAETIREWIAAGARWPDGPAGQLRPRH
jgi:hypothetical protein